MKRASKDKRGYRGPMRYRDPHPWERKVLALISEQVAIPMDLLAGFLKIPPAQATRLMEEFATYRWVGMSKFLVNDEVWVWLRQSGAKYTPFHSKTPSLWGLPHRRAISVARLKLETLHPGAGWECERRLWHEKFEAHQIPDGVLRVRNEKGEVERWAVEAELSQKTISRYREIVVERCERYDKLIYYCTPMVAKRLGSLPEFTNNPNVTIEEVFDESQDCPLFQWEWSEHSGPDEAPPSRPPTPGELEVMRLIAEQGAIPIDQLARYLGCAFHVAAAFADRLDEAGFVCQARGPLLDTRWVWVTKIGGRYTARGLKAFTPHAPSMRVYRLINEARIHVAERDPNVRWQNMRLLRLGAEDKSVPIAIVEDQGEQHAIEIEYKRRGRREMIEKYNKRCSEFDAVAVFCSARRVRTFLRLKEACGWDNLFVESFEALQSGAINHLPPARPLVLNEIPLEDLPSEALHAVQRKEGSATPPQVEWVGRYGGKGFPRWRVVTEKGKWRVFDNPYGWFVHPTRPEDEPEAIAEAAARAQASLPREEPRPMKSIPPEEFPEEGLLAIQAKADLRAPPSVEWVKKRRGAGYPRWLVQTDAGLWRVTNSAPYGWVAKPGSLSEELKELKASSLPPPCPRDPPELMKDVDPWDVPEGALKAIQEAAGLPAPPRAASASQRKGSGGVRYRIETVKGVWRVTRGSKWKAVPSE